MTREEETVVITRVLGGDANAFETLVLEYQKQVYNQALRLLDNEEDALDASQDAFLRAYRSLGGFRGESKFSVWLYRLTSNICIDKIRGRKRQQTVSLTVANEDEEPRDQEIPDERSDPAAVLDSAETLRAVADGLNSLSEDYRQILILREINGLSYDEIGSVLQLEVGTVKSRIFRARRQLSGFLMDTGNFCEKAPSDISKEVREA